MSYRIEELENQIEILKTNGNIINRKYEEKIKELECNLKQKNDRIDELKEMEGRIKRNLDKLLKLDIKELQNKCNFYQEKLVKELSKVYNLKKVIFSLSLVIVLMGLIIWRLAV